jgi:hypothetical protein
MNVSRNEPRSPDPDHERGENTLVAFTGTELCSALQRNFVLCISRKGTARPQAQFRHSRACERCIYSNHQSTYFPTAEYADLSWEYINRTQEHECWNWDCGRAIVSNFRNSIFAV